MTSNTAIVHRRREHARYGAASQREFEGPLPQPFPREIGPRAMEYLAEVVDSGLACDMVGRFEDRLRRGPRRRTLHRHAGMHAGLSRTSRSLRL